MERRKSRTVTIGSVAIGGRNPVAVQSMTNTKTENIPATVEQIRRLTDRGCELIRCAVPTLEAAQALKAIREQITIPWWQISISITGWPWRPWKAEWMPCG